MKRYIKASSEKPVLNHVEVEWSDIDNGIKYTVYSESGETLFEIVYSFEDVDPDAVYDSAIDMAILALSQKYELSDQAISEIKQSVDIDSL